ncbi:hypothetical protein PACTADRAFT_4769 [Pachysolen tannophilus NRRL Y-2460]|uniref:IBB domain-containing protein n=1 Tax=Pachysolen tannophilus NRRL Y-2460 TaxID=669874 RepID=A0A1E4TQ41_PACTA|nr:hypothetical protein PACTADRAFT_4769 [Pachysolen tannophilus NRRL Y-2460]
MDMDTTTRFIPDHRKNNFKNRDRFQADELRRRRQGNQVSLRKQKKEEQLMKIRKIHKKRLEEEVGNNDENQELRIEDNGNCQYSNPSLIPVLQDILFNLQATNDAEKQFSSLCAFRDLLSSSANSNCIPPLDESISLGFIPILIGFLERNDEKFQYESLWSLTNIACGNTNHTRYLIEEGNILPVLMGLLQSTTNLKIKEEAIWCLGNLCIDNLNAEEVRNYIIISGGIVKLIEILLMEDNPQQFGSIDSSSSSFSLKRKASWVFMQLCKTDRYGRLPSSNWNVLRYVIPQLYSMLNHPEQDPMVLKDLLMAIEFLSNELLTNIRSSILMDFKIHELIIKDFLKLKKHRELKSHCIQIMKNIITATSQKATPILVECGLLKDLLIIFTSSAESINLKRDCCSLIGLINKCSPEMIYAIFDTNLIPPLIHLLVHGDYQTRTEACLAICNAIQYSSSQQEQLTTIDMPKALPKSSVEIIPFLVKQGIFKPLCDLLFIATTDVQQVILNSLDKILATGEYLSQKGYLQNYNQANEYAIFFEDCGGVTILETLMNDFMNGNDDDDNGNGNGGYNEELVRSIEALFENYINNKNEFYPASLNHDAPSAVFKPNCNFINVINNNSHNLINSNVAGTTGMNGNQSFRFGNIEDSNTDGTNDIVSSLEPKIGDNGFFEFG